MINERAVWLFAQFIQRPKIDLKDFGALTRELVEMLKDHLALHADKRLLILGAAHRFCVNHNLEYGLFLKGLYQKESITLSCGESSDVLGLFLKDSQLDAPADPDS